MIQWLSMMLSVHHLDLAVQLGPQTLCCVVADDCSTRPSVPVLCSCWWLLYSSSATCGSRAQNVLIPAAYTLTRWCLSVYIVCVVWCCVGRVCFNCSTCCLWWHCMVLLYTMVFMYCWWLTQLLITSALCSLCSSSTSCSTSSVVIATQVN